MRWRGGHLRYYADFVAVEQQLGERSPDRVPELRGPTHACHAEARAHFANVWREMHELVAAERQRRQVAARGRGD